VPDLDLVFVGDPTSTAPSGPRVLARSESWDVPAVIANAVYHATGRRIRSLPIAIEQLF
jgi:CO/xanthine dehydrogenase Mo-binding subunit